MAVVEIVLSEQSVRELRNTSKMFLLVCKEKTDSHEGEKWITERTEWIRSIVKKKKNGKKASFPRFFFFFTLQFMHVCLPLQWLKE